MAALNFLFRIGPRFLLLFFTILIGSLTVLSNLAYSAVTQPPGQPPLPIEVLSEFQNDVDKAQSPESVLDVYEKYLIIFGSFPPNQLKPLIKELYSLDISEELEERHTAYINALYFYKYFRTQPEAAIEYGVTAYEYFENTAELHIKYQFLNSLIIALLSSQKYLDAETYLLSTIDELENLPVTDTNEVIEAMLFSLYGNAGNMYSQIQAYDQAAFMMKKALEFRSNPTNECNASISLASIYYEMELFEDASNQLKICFTAEHLLPDIAAQARISQSRIQLALGDTNSTIQNLRDGLSYAEMGRNTVSQKSMIHSYLTRIFIDTGDVEQAGISAAYLLSLEPPLPVTPDGLAFAYFEVARYLYTVKEYERSLEYAGYVTAIFDRTPRMMHDYADGIYALKASIYVSLDDANNAIEAYRKHSEFFNRLEIREREIARNTAQVRYQLILNEAELASAIQAQEKSGFRFWLAALFSIFALSIAFILFTQYRKSKDVIKEKDKALTEAELETKRLKEFAHKQTALLKERKQKENSSIIVQFHDKVSLSAEIISHIQSDGNYVRVYYQKNEDMDCEIIRMSLKKCYSMLPDEIFYRIHRQIIVNINFIDNILNDELYLKNGTNLQIGKTYGDKLDFIDSRSHSAA